MSSTAVDPGQTISRQTITGQTIAGQTIAGQTIAGQTIAGRYRIERLLGQGGMGSVYRAVQVSLDRPVALKRLVAENLECAAHVERFEREAHALARLVHRSTVRLFDFGTDERRCPFIVMELLHGCDLANDIERQGPLRWDHALQVCQQILGSLAEAHAAGIIHRDIKPANIFLCLGAEWPTVKVLDFGIAGGPDQDGAAPRLTLTGTVLGSAAYMSPEQAQGKQVGPSADLYALGVVLFEMLTGRVPFDAPLLTAQLLAKVLEPAPKLKHVCPGLEVPEGVQALLAALLERDAARRPASARAVAELIARLLSEARLAPLRRVVQLTGVAVRSGVPRTEPMLAPNTFDHGWAPPRTDSVVPRAPLLRSRRLYRWAVAVAFPIGAVGALGWELRSDPRAAAPLAQLPRVPAASFTTAVAVGEGLQAPDELPSELEGAAEAVTDTRSAPEGSSKAVEQPLRTATQAVLPKARKPIKAPRARAGRPAVAGTATDPTAVTATAAENAGRAAVVSATDAATAADPAATVAAASAAAAAAATADGALAAAPSGPEPSAAATTGPDGAVAPATTPERSLAVLPRTGSYRTVAAADAAEGSGRITPLQRNDIIAALRQRRLDARARVARDHRQGRISLAELRERQRVIDREFEGLERAAFAVPAGDTRARKRRLLRIGPRGVEVLATQSPRRVMTNGVARMQHLERQGRSPRLEPAGPAVPRPGERPVSDNNERASGRCNPSSPGCSNAEPGYAPRSATRPP